MPLITFTGLPCSGKTTWAKKLVAELQSKIDNAASNNEPGHNYKIVYHSDETLGISHESYRESTPEKSARSAQMSAVKRDLSRTTFVILDSLSYIKGFRYQLYCEAKGMGTPHCVVHVVNSLDKCLEWNAATGQKWDPEVITQLQMRYEEPRNDTRWDSPLFELVSDYASETLPVDDMWNALVLKRAAPPNAATVVKPVSSNDYLQVLDQKTQDVIARVNQQQQISPGGGDFSLSDGLVVELPPRTVSIAQLQRVRRTFISLNRMRNLDADRITPLFVDYLNLSLNSE